LLSVNHGLSFDAPFSPTTTTPSEPIANAGAEPVRANRGRRKLAD
jgi:hypothetical protein